MPDIEKDIYPVLGCSMEKLIKESTKRRVIPQHILKRIAAYPTNRGEYSLIEKLTKWIMDRVDVFASTKSFPLLGEKAIRSVEPYIYKTLYTICFRTYTYDFNKIKNASPAITFEQYDQLFNDPVEVENFFRRYPAIADIITHHRNKIVALVSEILIAYHRDISAIKDTFNLRNNTITQITMGMGDSHNGKTVTLIHLKDEKLLFKPSAGHVNTFFAHVAKKFSAASDIAIYTPKVILRDTWHWCEFIQPEPCANEHDVASFYEAIGAQIMLVYALNGHDVHYENLIAMGKFPVIIDLECLFSAIQQESSNGPLADSVLSTSMLPSMRTHPAGRYISAISAIDNEKCAYRYIIEENDRGLAVVTRQKAAFKTLANLPELNGQKVTAVKFGEHILSGFAKAWEFVKTHREYLFNLLENYPSGLKVRTLYQGSEIYNRLLALSYHPRFLQDKASRALCLLTVLEMDEKYGVARNSYQALLNGDIPYHTSTLRYRGRDENTLLNNLAQRQDSLTEDSFRFQSNLIRLSIDSLADDKKNDTESPETAPLSSADGLAAAENIFAAILNTQFQGKFFYYRRELKLFSEMQNSLYSGTAGLAFISLCLYIATKNKDYLDKAITLTDGTFTPDNAEFGAFVGEGSYAWILEFLYTLTGETHYLTRAINIMQDNLDCATSDNILHEFLKGHAGCMVIALNLLRHDRHNPHLLSAIHSHLNAIIAGCQNVDNEKITWDSGLTGFSHGNAGIIYALGLYLEQCGIESREQITDIIRKAINYENQFKTETGWQDLRATDEEKSDSLFWCHGAPGIALSRQKVKALDLPSVEEDLSLARRLINQQEKNGAFSLCHSRLGNLLIADHISVGESRETLTQMADALLYSLNSETRRLDIALLNTDISLMTGICGVLYAWLYVNYPVPFILTLAPCPELTDMPH
ncbi:type 2 lanthipeptide synthetase LanM [Vagococcus sp. WN89Y]|uniref:type 2 lanthipeptide synthetase LanM n=1 Tax=Vagococcus sp. WN89Y TaxID=3457258 RepID=UPI003FCEC4EC